MELITMKTEGFRYAVLSPQDFSSKHHITYSTPHSRQPSCFKGQAFAARVLAFETDSPIWRLQIWSVWEGEFYYVLQCCTLLREFLQHTAHPVGSTFCTPPVGEAPVLTVFSNVGIFSLRAELCPHVRGEGWDQALLKRDDSFLMTEILLGEQETYC